MNYQIKRNGCVLPAHNGITRQRALVIFEDIKAKALRDGKVVHFRGKGDDLHLTVHTGKATTIYRLQKVSLAGKGESGSLSEGNSKLAGETPAPLHLPRD